MLTVWLLAAAAEAAMGDDIKYVTYGEWNENRINTRITNTLVLAYSFPLRATAYSMASARHGAFEKLIHNTILDSAHADMRLRNTCIMFRSGSQSVNERAMAHKRVQVKPKEFRIQSMQRGDQQNGITFVALFVWTEKKKKRREEKIIHDML